MAIMSIPLVFALVFVASFIADFVWAAYIMATSEKKALKAALLSGIIVVMGIFVTLSWLEDKRTIVAATVGGILGTYFCVKYTK